MTTLMNEIVLAGGTGAFDPALYDARLAGFGSCEQDLHEEEPQPDAWRSGAPKSWCEIWLGVD